MNSIVEIDIDRLKEDPLNLRHHGNENIEMLKKSLSENHQYRPLLVDEKSMTVKIGNGRLRAMRELGWKKCWCVLVDFDSHEGMEVLDNRLNELSEWEKSDSTDDWLLNDKGIDWWGVDSATSVRLFESTREKKKEPSAGVSASRSAPARKEKICPCCGKPLHKVKPILL